MARAQLVALACAGVLIGVQPGVQDLASPGWGERPPSGASLLDPWLGPSWSCWQVAARDVRDRIELVAQVGREIGDGNVVRRPGVRSVPSRPAWLACFD
ncbi:hypothetical protein [Nocardioides campestrisoli]|uniref:hypothetical protein n=1 Tax=Nocardioides campestrisoli TaxID=2736757 RepID=UPI0015E6F49F|nr:hypothetical protein [Nocardioides campestrisoli]